MNMATVAAEMALEAIRSFKDGGAPHMVITGPERGTTFGTIEKRARTDPQLSRDWTVVRVDVTDASEADELWRRAAAALGEPVQGTEPPLVTVDRAIRTSSRKLLVLTTGFDKMLTRLAAGETDWVLRKTLQMDQRILIVGRAETLPPAATNYENAFYQFFTERRTTPD